MGKKSRDGYEPSWTEVTIGALLSVLIGAALGVVFLVIKPVSVVKELPKEEEIDHSTVYFVEGSRDAAKAKLAPAKRKTFASGGSVVVDENEINSFGPALKVAAAKAPAAQQPPPQKATPPAKPTDPKAKAPAPATPAVAADLANVGLVASAPNFRLQDNQVQLGVPVNINLFGLDVPVLVQTRGTFVKSGETFVFAPDTMMVGSCPVDRLPMARDFVMKKIIATQTVPEDIAKSWAKLSDVAVVGAALKLTMP